MSTDAEHAAAEKVEADKKAAEDAAAATKAAASAWPTRGNCLFLLNTVSVASLVLKPSNWATVAQNFCTDILDVNAGGDGAPLPAGRGVTDGLLRRRPSLDRLRPAVCLCFCCFYAGGDGWVGQMRRRSVETEWGNTEIGNGCRISYSSPEVCLAFGCPRAMGMRWILVEMTFMKAPNRVPPGRLSLEAAHLCRFRLLNCRHGFVLIYDGTRHQFLVWDPITGDQHHLAIPAPFDKAAGILINGAVLRAVGDIHHFRVVCIATRGLSMPDGEAALACVYSSETGMWGNLISTTIPSGLDSRLYYIFDITVSTVPMLVGHYLYWTLTDCSSIILQFDLEKQSLALIRMPDFAYEAHIMVIRADGGGLGFLFVADYTIQLWKRKISCNGVASWWLEKTIELDKLLSLNPKKGSIMVLGFAEENNMVFLRTFIGLFALQLQSLQFKKLSKTESISHCHPFESVYTAGNNMPFTMWA
ncbi:hypothetical protein TRIUR3_25485 [Triticum urartu]|uniref:F-box protein AT5G49610-like beta-propeller domain-containing protein n=1 Tax=Triticum urartu TaxID=4572 RepID=M7ZVV0_TRIUA|nr:hypothetical protein TRIUR3_25485 [Triticum urartu]